MSVQLKSSSVMGTRLAAPSNNNIKSCIGKAARNNLDTNKTRLDVRAHTVLSLELQRKKYIMAYIYIVGSIDIRANSAIVNV